MSPLVPRSLLSPTSAVWVDREENVLASWCSAFVEVRWLGPAPTSKIEREGRSHIRVQLLILPRHHLSTSLHLRRRPSSNLVDGFRPDIPTHTDHKSCPTVFFKCNLAVSCRCCFCSVNNHRQWSAVREVSETNVGETWMVFHLHGMTWSAARPF